MNKALFDALDSISPTLPYDRWWRVLAALKTEFGDNGKEIARVWSAQSGKYRPSEFEATWRSLKPGKITAGTVFHFAKQSGWQRDPNTKPSKAYRAPPRLIPATQTPRPQAPTLYKAKRIWAAICNDRRTRSDFYTSQHPYAMRKGITWAAGAARARVRGTLIGNDSDCIVVPMRTLHGKFVGIECINPKGKKQTFGSKGVLILGNDLDDSLPQWVVEGWACGVGLFLQYSGNVAIYCCFGKSMLKRNAEAIAKKYPYREVTVGREQDD